MCSFEQSYLRVIAECMAFEGEVSSELSSCIVAHISCQVTKQVRNHWHTAPRKACLNGNEDCLVLCCGMHQLESCVGCAVCQPALSCA